MTNGTQPQQNKAHRDEDALGIWVKSGRSEYRNFDGVTIRKTPGRQWWWAYGPDGEHLLTDYGSKVGGHSLTWAKLAVDHHANA